MILCVVAERRWTLYCGIWGRRMMSRRRLLCQYARPASRKRMSLASECLLSNKKYSRTKQQDDFKRGARQEPHQYCIIY